MKFRDADFDPVGFEPMDAAWWPEIANALPRPWPKEAAWMDLRWWRGQVRATARVAQEIVRDGRGRFKVARMPGRPALRARWGWTDHGVQTLLADEASWRDRWTQAAEPAADSESTANQQPADSEPTAAGPTNAANPEETNIPPTANQQPADSPPPRALPCSPLHRLTEAPVATASPPLPLPPAAPAANRLPPEALCNEPPVPTTPSTTTATAPTAAPPTTTSAETSTSTPPSPPTSAPSWLPKPRDRSGHAPEALCRLVRDVVAARDRKKPDDVNLDRCGTAARPIFALWTALGMPPPDELRDDLCLVVRWARLSPDRLAARDIRGEGWEGAPNRCGDLSTLCVQGRWDARLAAARLWHRDGATRAAAPKTDTGGTEAWEACEALIRHVSRGDPIPEGRTAHEARLLDVFARCVRWDRWFNRSDRTRAELRQRFLDGWTAAPTLARETA